MTETYAKTRRTGFRYNPPEVKTYLGVPAMGASMHPLAWTTYSYTRSLIGEKNPRWKSQVRLKQNATTPMTAREKYFEATPGYWETYGNYEDYPQSHPSYNNRWQRTCMNGVLGPTGSAVPGNLDADTVPQGNAEAKAAGEWYRVVRNRMSTFKGAVFAGESRQAKRMMIDRSFKMLNMIPPFQTRLRRGWVRSRTKRGKLKTLANNWLELQFGWLPLIGDVEDAIKALQEPRGQTAFVKALGGHSSASTSVTHNGQGQLRWETNSIQRTDYTVMYSGVIRCRDATQVGSLRRDFGLTVREFLPTAWEVLPWSFAIDYFTNVSEIVDAVSYRDVEIVWAKKTVRRERSRRSSPGAVYAFNNLGSSFKLLTNIPSKWYEKDIRTDRTAISTVEIPPLRFELPGLKQTINLAALAVSRRLRLAY